MRYRYLLALLLILLSFGPTLEGEESDFGYTSDDVSNDEEDAEPWAGVIESDEDIQTHTISLMPGVKSGVWLIVDNTYIMLLNSQSVCGTVHYWECRHRKTGCRHRMTTEVVEPCEDPAKEEHKVAWMLSLDVHNCGQDEVSVRYCECPLL